MGKFKGFGKSMHSKKQRKRHFTAPSHIRRRIMSSHLSPELKKKHNVRTMPVRKDDEVRIMVGKKGVKGTLEGKVVACMRKNYAIHIDGYTREKANGTTVHIPVHPSNVMITKLKMTKDRKDILQRRAAGRAESLRRLGRLDSGKYSESDVAMAQVD
eukprot:gb/GECH01007726.1/.p1 GENE.gb/GECH01007726.1/~~gb/GECH01007726.1/.p1  ORF type:complete len:157 (+),score=30.26 gb/GECH01007726.1/:1-471(+)